jgi:hypothetical protein
MELIPCIATTLKNGETLYLLDDNKNMVYCSQNDLASLNLEHIQDNFNNNIFPYLNKYFIYNAYLNNCNRKQVPYLEKPNLTKKPEEFLANEVIINGEILNNYNLSDISLNIFEKTKLFKIYIDTNNLQLYNQLNNNEKKRLVFTLYYDYIIGDNFLFNVLKNKLNIERENRDFNDGKEKDYIQQYYKDNKKQIQDSIDVLTEFRDVFIIVVGKDKFKIVGGIFGLICIIFGSIALIAIIAIIIYYSRRRRVNLN